MKNLQFNLAMKLLVSEPVYQRLLQCAADFNTSYRGEIDMALYTDKKSSELIDTYWVQFEEYDANEAAPTEEDKESDRMSTFSDTMSHAE